MTGPEHGSSEMLLPEDLVADMQQTRSSQDGELSRKQRHNAMDRDSLETALIKFAGDCNKTAQNLGMDRSTVY